MLNNSVAQFTYDENKKYLDLDSEFLIRHFLTKQMNRILCLLWNHAMGNKEIAEEMGISSSALSNILQRMKKCEVTLLTAERKEKRVIYSLTPAAEEYVEKFLKNKEEKNKLKIVHINENETIELLNCRNSLEKLKEKFGDEWGVEFSRYCVLYYENGEMEKIPEADMFFEELEELIIKDQVTQLEDILNRLEDETSKKICMKYIAKYEHIRWLCELDEKNWKLAYQLIDDIFRNEKIYISCTFLEQSKELSINDIVNIAKAVFEIVVCSKEKRMTKEEFLKNWNKYFFPHERLFYYLAEKYGNKYAE